MYEENGFSEVGKGQPILLAQSKQATRKKVPQKMLLLTSLEGWLSLFDESTAVIRKKYVVPMVNPVTVYVAVPAGTVAIGAP